MAHGGADSFPGLAGLYVLGDPVSFRLKLGDIKRVVTTHFLPAYALPLGRGKVFKRGSVYRIQVASEKAPQIEK